MGLCGPWPHYPCRFAWPDLFLAWGLIAFIIKRPRRELDASARKGGLEVAQSRYIDYIDYVQKR